MSRESHEHRETRKETKASRVFADLRRDITAGVFAPGERLPLATLGERYGVGFSPLREALFRLQSKGIVQLEEQCGFRVTPWSLAELADLYQVRGQIEALALTGAIQHGDESWLAELRVSWQVFRDAIDPEQGRAPLPQVWDDLQRRFLYDLVKGCRSPWLVHLHSLLYDQAERYRRVCIERLCSQFEEQQAVVRKFIDDHAALVEAVLARDSERALRIAKALWEDSIRTIAASSYHSRMEDLPLC